MKDGGLIEQNERKTGGGGQDMNNVELFFFISKNVIYDKYVYVRTEESIIFRKHTIRGGKVFALVN